jgi:uncharacterized protein YbbC (DUF1343 family)
MTSFKLGIENLVKQEFAPLRGKCVGLMSNPSAVDSKLRMTYDILRNAPEVNLTTLFAPEHGFLGATPDGEKIDSQIDTHTGIAVFSLYGDSLRPSSEMLSKIDVMVCDIQDIGVRYYTFLWTISHIIEACGENEVPVVILDRPNPLGDIVNGSPLEAEFASLVGRYNIPIQHGMTLGEMLNMLNQIVNPYSARLRIIPCEGYQHGMSWEDTRLHFIPPSPNIPHLVTAKHYPGACLIEGTNLSEGRGTTLPFEIVGAPFINAMSLADSLNALNLSGILFRAHHFKPTSSKYIGKDCHGVQAHIVDEQIYEPIRTWLNVIHSIRHSYPGQFQWREPHRPNGLYPFDRLIGNADVRQQIDDGVDIETISADWSNYAREFREKRQPYLLYD